MSGAIAIFVKTPGLSPVKTRLAATLGQQKAEEFHLTSAHAVSSVVQKLSKLADVHCYYAVAEQSAINHSNWEDLPCLWQGEGGLGERMASIYQRLLSQHEFVILVGADIPQMNSSELLNASTWLADTEPVRLAFAPSFDGGFWLIGGNCKIPQNIWTDVIYSKAKTGTQFFNKIKPLGNIKILSCLRDIDEVQDLIPLRKALLDLSEPLMAQRDLLQFLDTLPLWLKG